MPLIAVLDDDINLWQMYAKCLRELDVEVVQYVNKIEFFLDPPRLKPDLIVTDIQSPKMDGYEFLTLVKQDPEYRNIPVIVVTVAVEYDDTCESRARSLGAFSVVPKRAGFLDMFNNVQFALEAGKNELFN